MGHQVSAAASGREALELWEESHHSLIISDWMMPALDGLDLCRAIRAQKGSDFSYIILLTARSGKSNYFEAMKAGADDFVGKPFEKEQLAARVRVAERILGLHESLRLANTGLEKRVLERTLQLEKANCAKVEFLARASHELRTPMNHILDFAQLLERNSLTPDQHDSVNHMLQSGRSLLRLIDRILAFSKSTPVGLNCLERTEVENECK